MPQEHNEITDTISCEVDRNDMMQFLIQSVDIFAVAINTQFNSCFTELQFEICRCIHQMKWISVHLCG